MRAMIAALLAAAALSGCAGEKAEPTPTTAYLLIPATSDDAGWALVDALGAELPEADRRRIGAPSVVSDRSSAMLIPFSGTCEADAALVARVAALAQRRGIAGTRCSATIPG